MKKYSDPLVRAVDLGVQANGKWRVRHVDLTIDRGEIVTLIGPNGSGKSTTAKAVLGLISPTEGHVTRSKDLKVGYVPQSLAIDWTMPLTVERLMRLTGKQSSTAIDRSLASVGASHLVSAAVQTLSGGEFQRVLIARALTTEPDLLVLDEPVQNIDFKGQIDLYQMIGDIRRRLNCGVLMISHDLHIVMAETDKVLCLNGHVCCHGSPEAVALSSEYRNLFGPGSADALALYRHHHDHHHADDGSVVHRGTILPSPSSSGHEQKTDA